MSEPPLDPQRTYEALAEALRLFFAHPPTDQALTAVREAVTQATEVWQRCEWQRTTSTKEFRAHVVRLKLLLAGVYQTLDLRPGVPCQAATPSYPALAPLLDRRNTEESAGDIYRGVDKEGQTIDFFLSERRRKAEAAQSWLEAVNLWRKGNERFEQ